jgi:DNA-directed RNA polymerase subunit E'/Rpb7
MQGAEKNKGRGNAASRLGAGVRASPIHCLLFCVIATTAAFAADPAQKTFSLTISQGTIPARQRVLRVDKDDMVRLRVVGDAPGEIHLHGYRLELKVTTTGESELSFRAHATGRYRIEWHPAGEDAKKGDHHGPPLATLEVRPK